MPQYRILETEPTDYSHHDLEADGRLPVVPASPAQWKHLKGMGRKA